jgi:hypothetical protein
LPAQRKRFSKAVLPENPISTKRTHFSNLGRFDPGLIPGWDCLYLDSIEKTKNYQTNPFSLDLIPFYCLVKYGVTRIHDRLKICHSGEIGNPYWNILVKDG